MFVGHVVKETKTAVRRIPPAEQKELEEKQELKPTETPRFSKGKEAQDQKVVVKWTTIKETKETRWLNSPKLGHNHRDAEDDEDDHEDKEPEAAARRTRPRRAVRAPVRFQDPVVRGFRGGIRGNRGNRGGAHGRNGRQELQEAQMADEEGEFLLEEGEEVDEGQEDLDEDQEQDQEQEQEVLQSSSSTSPRTRSTRTSSTSNPRTKF